MWGQVGCASGISIGNDAVILAQSGISKSLDGNATYFGSPCSEVREKFKEIAALKQLPDFLRKHQ
jgi:UDP-3-O-[3-hydroxymyristoyl] glucosamine N-acyltransferase